MHGNGTPNNRDIANIVAFIGAMGAISTMYLSISGRALEIERRISRLEGNIERIARGQQPVLYSTPSDRSWGASE